MTTDSATAGPVATGASPAGAVPGPFPPRRDRRPSRRRPWGRPRRRPRPLHPGPRRGRHQRQGPRHRPGRVHPRLRLRRRRRLPPPPRLGGAGRRGRLGGPDGGHPRLPGGRGRPPRPALRSPTSASPSSSETPSPAGPWPRSWAGRTRAPPPRARPPTAPAPRRGCWVSSPPASSWPDPAPFAARFRERVGFQSNARLGGARSRKSGGPGPADCPELSTGCALSAGLACRFRRFRGGAAAGRYLARVACSRMVART